MPKFDRPAETKRISPLSKKPVKAKKAAKKPAKKSAKKAVKIVVKKRPAKAAKKAAPKKAAKKVTKKTIKKVIVKKKAVKRLAKKSPVKKSTAKKAVAKKVPAKKLVAKKIAPKKVIAKKAVPKKAAPKKIAPKKLAALNVLPQEAARYVGPAWPMMDLILNVLDDAKAENTVAIHLQGRSSMADGMVVTTGRVNRHVAAIADQLLTKLKTYGTKNIRVEGLEQGDWCLVDAGDIIIHIFRPEVRLFYNLEKLWSPDAPKDQVE